MHYHVWFVTKYRRSILSGKIEKEIQKAFQEVIRNKNYNVLAIAQDLTAEDYDQNGAGVLYRGFECLVPVIKEANAICILTGL